jgi:hypothetical protein
MIIKKDTLEVIGDLGFKGFNMEKENIDLGYGIYYDQVNNNNYCIFTGDGFPSLLDNLLGVILRNRHFKN